MHLVLPRLEELEFRMALFEQDPDIHITLGIILQEHVEKREASSS